MHGIYVAGLVSSSCSAIKTSIWTAHRHPPLSSSLSASAIAFVRDFRLAGVLSGDKLQHWAFSPNYLVESGDQPLPSSVHVQL
jgi:hypothetical protein